MHDECSSESTETRNGDAIVRLHGYEDRYLISRNGTVVSMLSGFRILKEAGALKTGYLTYVLFDGNNYTTKLLHRMLMQTFCWQDGCEDLDVNHINGKKSDNRLENLEWCTRLHNIRHSISIGHTRNIPEKSLYKAVIRNFLTKDLAEMAEELGVAYNTVRTISAKMFPASVRKRRQYTLTKNNRYNIRTVTLTDEEKKQVLANYRKRAKAYGGF